MLKSMCFWKKKIHTKLTFVILAVQANRCEGGFLKLLFLRFERKLWNPSLLPKKYCCVIPYFVLYVIFKGLHVSQDFFFVQITRRTKNALSIYKAWQIDFSYYLTQDTYLLSISTLTDIFMLWLTEKNNSHIWPLDLIHHNLKSKSKFQSKNTIYGRYF